MASTYSALKIELIGTGDQTGTWGATTNVNLGDAALGEAITGSADVAFSSADVTVTLVDTNATQTARNLRLNLTGTSGGARNLILGSGCQIEKLYLVNNGLADAVTVKNTTGTGIAVPAGKTMFVYNNGTNVVDAITHLTSLTTGVLSASGATTFTANTASTSTTTGTTVITGGLGVSGRVNAANFDGIVGANTAAAGSFSTLSASGVATFSAGTVALPAITTTGDTNTGIFFPAADTIAFTEGGAESMRIDSSGNVGIGTSSPAFLTEIVGGATTVETTLLQIRSNFGGIGTGSTIAFGNSTSASAGSGRVELAGIRDTASGSSFVIRTADSGGTIQNRVKVDESGIVTMNAYGAGAATFSASGVISSVSDETWKTKDGVPVNTDAMLQKLEPGYWFYNEEKAPIFGADRQLGFYAQNVHEAIGAEAAPTPEEGKPWGYYDRSVLAVAVMSLKNALNTIEELKQRIEVLENK